MKPDPKQAAGRAFVRSLNILLKFARLYGYDHSRTMEQLGIAWSELRTAVPEGSDTSLLLGATANQLLLDGVPLEGSPAEKQFALLLSSAGLASVQFFPNVTQDEIVKFARAFPTGKAKPSELAQQLKAALEGVHGIRTNEICFVATDSRLKDATSMAAQLAAASFGDDTDQFKQLLNDPQKLLELIAAAEGTKGGSGSGAGTGTGSGSAAAGRGTGTGSGESAYSGAPASVSGYYASSESEMDQTTSGRSAPGQALAGAPSGIPAGSRMGGAVSSPRPSSSSVNSPILSGVASAPGMGGGSPRQGTPLRSGDVSEEEILHILGALTSFGNVSSGQGGMAAAAAFQSQVAELPGRAQDTLRNALASIAAQAPNAKPDDSVLVQLAEHLAIRFALERYEKGEVKVNAVRQMLERMNQEIENLRKILGSHEDKMTDAGMMVETHKEILDRQFWAAVPENGKRAVLLSDEAWCIPPRNVQSYVAELIERGEVAEAISILQNYASCAGSEETDARKRTAAGLSELAELYAKADPRLLSQALRHLGVRLSVEQDAELQGLVSAAFVRLSQEAASNRCFPAMEQALDLLIGVESQRPGIARELRSKMGIEQRVPEFVEEALKARQLAAGLTSVLRMLPQPAMEQLASRFNRCQLREEAEHVANLAHDLGEEVVQFLRSAVRGGTITESVEMVGLLCRLDPQAVEVFLPARVKNFPRAAQDRTIRQISASGAPTRCSILLKLLDHVDPILMPLVIDEIGVTGDRDAIGRLLTIIDGDMPAGSGPFLQVKAVEAIGRLHAPESAPSLRRILEARKVFGWLHPQELRIAALQALEKLNPELAADFRPNSGLDHSDLTLAPLDVPANSKFVRQRRHTRVRLRKPVTAVSTNLKENCRLEIKTASLAGGIATIDRHMHPGTPVQLRFQVGLRTMQATALLRDYRAQDMAFEFVDMPLDERVKFRRLLADNLSSTPVEPAPAPVPLAPAAKR
ncbi:MAG: hypothetical protein JSS69_10205 [Acidobacteria bacterium]|nr:hypothetical protein [Acidobacteriota bacterium]MBS1866276.1 hypothetical protein [Acidobacteriota bacterium]